VITDYDHDIEALREHAVQEARHAGEIVTRLVKAMVASGLDALVVVSPENFAYISGFVVPSQSLMRWRHAAYVVTASDGVGFWSWTWKSRRRAPRPTRGKSGVG